MPNTKAKTKLIQIRVSPQFHALVLIAARKERRKVGQFCRIAVEDAVERILPVRMAELMNESINEKKNV